MQNWSIKDAPVINKSLSDFINNIYSKSPTTRNFNEQITEYLFSQYDDIQLTESEEIIGLSDGNIERLFDVKDRKPHLDLP